MNYTNTSSEFIKCFLPIINKNNVEETKILKIIYNDIYKAYKENINNKCLKCNLQKITDINKAKQSRIYNSKFFPSYIKKYIRENELYQLIYTCNINSRIIKIYFTLFSEEEVLKVDNKYLTSIKMIYLWLNICSSYSSKLCAKTLDIYIYPTPFVKELPNNLTITLGVEHVNTAFTINCSPEGEIIIFRNEEWFKVLIHETFHAYGLDSTTYNKNNLIKVLSTIFPIDSDYNISEAYAETWARIMNSALCSFNALKNKEEFSIFIKNMSVNLQLERVFSFYQCNKVLGFMGLTYNNIHEPGEKNAYLRNHLYKENTHVFAYYILTSIFLNDYSGFLSWCNNHNTSLLQLNANSNNFNDLGKYIKTHYNNEGIINGITKHKNKNIIDKDIKIVNSTRMSIVEFI